MEKRKITAREVLADIRVGKNDSSLMQKYSLSAQGLQSVFQKLLRAGLITQQELNDRNPVSEQTVDIGLFICPACGNIQGKEFVTCPRCQFSLPGKAGSGSTTATTTAVETERDETRKKPSVTKSPARHPDFRNESAPATDLLRMAGYCRTLGIAAIVTYVIAVIGILAYLFVPSPSFGVSVLIGLVALGIPAVVLSIIVFMTMRVLTEAIKFLLSSFEHHTSPSAGD
ncbi:ATP synthase subunit I [Desulfomonile tiedjei]|uniref:Uncharacterized protein n=1 Tax=Desulfomonile tiedjei (strain ATCC 49306 / DSM 6799 / DCB-1) TaxID=706587 RepID=I4CE99_DESTA|nr:ATP synthase subunit I [Desulfomonile tiedjei]AFM27890.1 hypothetical protein Desti_5301 [Desulfomonile tiedjei DSM 6799]